MVNALSHSSSFFAGWVYFGVYCKRYGRSFALLYLSVPLRTVEISIGGEGFGYVYKFHNASLPE